MMTSSTVSEGKPLTDPYICPCVLGISYGQSHDTSDSGCLLTAATSSILYSLLTHGLGMRLTSQMSYLIKCVETAHTYPRATA